MISLACPVNGLYNVQTGVRRENAFNVNSLAGHVSTRAYAQSIREFGALCGNGQRTRAEKEKSSRAIIPRSIIVIGRGCRRITKQLGRRTSERRGGPEQSRDKLTI